MAQKLKRYARRGGLSKYKQDVNANTILTRMQQQLNPQLQAHKANSAEIAAQQRRWLSSKEEAQKAELNVAAENQKLEVQKQNLKIKQTEKVAKQIAQRGKDEAKGILDKGKKLAAFSDSIFKVVDTSIKLLDQKAYSDSLEAQDNEERKQEEQEKEKKDQTQVEKDDTTKTPPTTGTTPEPEKTSWETKGLRYDPQGDNDGDGIPNIEDINDPSLDGLRQRDDQAKASEIIEAGLQKVRNTEIQTLNEDLPINPEDDPAETFEGQARAGFAENAPVNKLRNARARYRLGELNGPEEAALLAQQIQSERKGISTADSWRAARSQIIDRYGARGSFTSSAIKFKESLVNAQSRALKDERIARNKTKQRKLLEGFTTSIQTDSSAANLWSIVDEMDGENGSGIRNPKSNSPFTRQEARRYIIDSLIEANDTAGLEDFFNSTPTKFGEPHTGGKNYGDLYPQDRRYATEQAAAKYRARQTDLKTKKKIEGENELRKLLPGFSAKPGDDNYEGSAAQVYDQAVAKNNPDLMSNWFDKKISDLKAAGYTEAANYVKSIAFQATQKREYATVEQWAKKLQDAGEHEELANFIRVLPTDERRKLEARFMPWLTQLEQAGVKSSELNKTFKRVLGKAIGFENISSQNLDIPTLGSTTAIAWGKFNSYLSDAVDTKGLTGEKAVEYAQRAVLDEIATGKEDITSPFHITTSADSGIINDQAYFTNQLGGIPKNFYPPNVIVDALSKNPLEFQQRQLFPTEDLKQQLDSLLSGDAIELTQDQQQVLNSLNGTIPIQDLITSQLSIAFPEQMKDKSLSIGPKDIIASRRLVPGVYWQKALRKVNTVQRALQLDLFATVKENFPPDSEPARSLVNRNALEVLDAGASEPLKQANEDGDMFTIKGFERKDGAVFSYGPDAARVLGIAKHQNPAVSGEDLLPAPAGIRASRPNVFYAVKGSPLYQWATSREGSGHVRTCTYEDLTKPITTLCFEPRK